MLYMKKILAISTLLVLLLFSGCTYVDTSPTYEDEAVIGIDYAHYKIHEGEHYFHMNFVDLSINAVRDIRITTGDNTKYSHFLFYLDAETETEWLFYENSTIITPGTNMTLRNNNRNSNKTSSMTIDYIDNGNLAGANADTTVSADDRLLGGLLGSGKTGGVQQRENEIILKPNTTYTLRLIANTAGFTDYLFEWYED